MNLRNDKYSNHKTQVIMPDRAIFFLWNSDSIQLNPHLPDSFYFSFNEKTDVEINFPEKLIKSVAADMRYAHAQSMSQGHRCGPRAGRCITNRIEYRLLLFVQNIKANLGGELCVLVCLIGCVAGRNKPNETFEVCCFDSITSDLWKLRASSGLLADLLWLPSDLMF